MKNILLFLSVSFLPFAAVAQPILTGATTNPIPGNLFYGRDQGDTTGISHGAAGAGVTWNLSFLDTAITDTTLYLSCASTPYCDSFPGSTVATFDGYNYNYFITNSTEFAVSGIGEPASTGGGFVYFPNPQSYLNYPTTYGSVYADSFYSVQPEFGDSSWGVDSFNADAYGTLILPSGTYENVLRIHVITHETDVFTAVDTALDTIVIADTFRSETYIWFDTGFHNPLLTMDYDTSGSVTYLSDAEYYTKPADSIPATDTTTGFVNIAGETGLQLYPNPASSLVHIQCSAAGGQGITVSAIDMLGRLAEPAEKFSTSTNDVSYNIADLPTGMYFIKVQTAGNVYLKKLEITR